MMNSKLTAASFVSLVLFAAKVNAQGWEDTFSFSGFGTVGIVRSDANRADFVGSVSHPDGAGYSHRWSADVDSKLGVQINADFTDRLSAVVQIVSEHRYDNRYTPEVEWANIKYQIAPDFDVRVGRTVDNLYMQSDIRLVGYAYPWVRRPREIYGLIPVSHKDGIDATYRSQIGEASNLIQISYGQTSLDFPGGREVEAKEILTLSNTVEYGALTARLGYTSLRADFNNTASRLFFSSLLQFGNTLSGIPSFQATGAQTLALFQKYKFEKAPYSVITLGANYDSGDWMVFSEWAKTPTSPALVPHSEAWYVGGGVRLGQFTPYMIFAKLKADTISEAGIALAGLPTPLAQTAAQLNGGLRGAISSFTFAQRSFSLGGRWDFMKNTDLKIQYDQLKTTQGTTGLLGNIQPGFQPGEKINVISATIDFVF